MLEFLSEASTMTLMSIGVGISFVVLGTIFAVRDIAEAEAAAAARLPVEAKDSSEGKKARPQTDEFMDEFMEPTGVLPYGSGLHCYLALHDD